MQDLEDGVGDSQYVYRKIKINELLFFSKMHVYITDIQLKQNKMPIIISWVNLIIFY